jgi:hypothetical protein
MRSECQFFMTPDDEAEFLAHAASTYQLGVTGTGLVCSLGASSGFIQYETSERFDLLLTAGRIALTTTGLDREPLFQPESAAVLERAYKGLRRWLQARYTNDLVGYSEFFPVGQRKVAPVRYFWLGPHARAWLLHHPGAVLRQFRTGRVVLQLTSHCAVRS